MAWEDLPAEILHEIIHRVPCRADRRCVGLACRAWRTALAELPHPPPPPLPWLILTSAVPTLSCVLSGCGTHEFRYPEPPVRYFGSYDGTWLFVAVEQTQHHVLANLRTEAIVALPDVFRLLPGPGDEDVHDMVIFAATLSSPPDDVQGCVAAGIVTFRHPRAAQRIAFWRMGDPLASGGILPLPPLQWPSMEVEDLLFHDGAFHFLTQRENIYVCAPNFLQDGGLQAEFDVIVPAGRPRIHDHNDGTVIARYLVVSRGKLLMVLRCAARLAPQPITSDFGVFEMVQGQMGANGEVEHSWNELLTLDGRMLFVGRGCSRSYEVALYPGFGDGVYFLDDDSFYEDETVFMDDDDDERAYSFIDNGKWSATPPRIDRCFPMLGSSSTYSSPVWLLP